VDYHGEQVTAFDSNGEFAGDAVLSDHTHVTPRRVRIGHRVERVPGHQVLDMKIRFLGFSSTGLQDALEQIAKRQRVEVPIVDLVFDDGTRLARCVVAGFFGGPLGERWYGIELGERIDVRQSA
jgi:hypothetical protein